MGAPGVVKHRVTVVQWPCIEGIALPSALLGSTRRSSRRVEPSFAPVHERLARSLVMRQARRGAHLVHARRFGVGAHLAEHLKYPRACVWQHRFQGAARATAMGQAGTANQSRCIGHRIAP